MGTDSGETLGQRSPLTPGRSRCNTLTQKRHCQKGTLPPSWDFLSSNLYSRRPPDYDQGPDLSQSQKPLLPPAELRGAQVPRE